MIGNCLREAGAGGSNPLSPTIFPDCDPDDPCGSLQNRACTNTERAYKARTTPDGVRTTLADWPSGSAEAMAILAGDEVFIRGPKRDFGDGHLRYQVYVKPKDWAPRFGTAQRPTPTTATIYFVGPEGGPVKIGYTANITLRLRDLRLANATPLMLWASALGSPSIERAYHRQFAAHRLHGEWFTRCPEIEAEIARLTLAATEAGNA